MKMSKIRLAGNALKWLFSQPNMVKGGAPQLMNAGEIALRIVPDVGFGVLTAANTPGDIVDKAVAGGAQMVGGIGGGLLLGKAGGRNQALSGLLDMAGSVGGDFAAMPASDMIQRGKDKLMGGEGQTAYERLSTEQQQQLASQIEQQVLQAYGLIPGSHDRFMMDPTTGMGVN